MLCVGRCVCRREESTRLKIELLFWIGPIKTKREERANGISSGGRLSLSSKGKKKDMVSSVFKKVP